MGYRRVEYIRTNFTWFNTNLHPNNNTKLEIDFKIASVNFQYSSNNCIFGNWQSGYSASNTIIFNIHSSSNFRCYVGGYFNDYVSRYTIGDRYRNTLDRNAFVINNLTSSSSYTQNIGRTLVASDVPILISAEHMSDSDPSDLIIYEALVYDGEDIVGHYLPYQDTETGYGLLYDTISNTYINADNPSVVTCGDPLFGPDTTELSFNANASSITVSLDSDLPWTATTNDSWITLSDYTGETGGEITVSVTSNLNNPLDRTGVVTFTDGENTATLTVTQKSGGKTVFLENLYRSGNKINLMFRNGRKIYQGYSKTGV